MNNYIRELGECKQKSKQRTTTPPPRTTPRWIPPAPGFAKIRVDGAVSKEANEGTYSVACRDSSGNYLESSVIRTLGITDPASLEALACREAQPFALDLSLSHVLIASDRQVMVNDIQKEIGGACASIVERLDQILVRLGFAPSSLKEKAQILKRTASLDKLSVWT